MLEKCLVWAFVASNQTSRYFVPEELMNGFVAVSFF